MCIICEHNSAWITSIKITRYANLVVIITTNLLGLILILLSTQQCFLLRFVTVGLTNVICRNIQRRPTCITNSTVVRNVRLRLPTTCTCDNLTQHNLCSLRTVILTLCTHGKTNRHDIKPMKQQTDAEYFSVGRHSKLMER